ncbi:Dam family site-specific DNA-(adenine-N6)-methyltransferase [Enterococcus sp. ALS3]|uniref:Dam family site-specific DNA-(Adenine-N6)-methyltransferase n=1 Tax=Enterococcus alishanensis TaxID=1303817 RepID=A0ABS6TE67_9ENTE|nr:Dam family site-specific DNA-(adenine-N6)-methyltransferase [Enterococcus alishanensis]MBV7391198.1 Dam family site-specific DNA-(adenine-N6)-methyltransferase [Enterococcus alishanensis]
MNNKDEEKIPKPFLRWAGGKTWLIKYLGTILKKKKFNNYFEPFLGGGALFLSINPKKDIFLSDLNEDLINAYKAVQRDPKKIVTELKSYKNDESFYYEMRSKDIQDPILRAAKFIYLNKTSFNGIYRVNNEGKYNVPFGFRSNYPIEEDNIFMVSERLQYANIRYGDFYENADAIKEGDLIILDPPYTVSHNENGFIKYNQKLFSLEDQYRLSDFIDHIKDSGAYYILTNAAHEKIIEIFQKDEDIRYDLSRANAIGGKNANRGQIKEFVFTNIKEG